MTGRLDKLRDLARIAGLMAERAQPPVVAARHRVAEQQRRVADLAARQAALLADGLDPVLAARLSRQAQSLRQHQIAAMSDLARAQVELELAIAAARPALARNAVIQELAKGHGRRR